MSSTMPAYQENDQSLEEIVYGDFYPKKAVTYEVQGLQIPFAPLSGEYIEYLGEVPEGIVALSNYRLFAHGKDVPMISLPLGFIESVETPAPNVLGIACKNGRYHRCVFESVEKVADWSRRLSDAIKGCAALSSCFAVSFCAWSRTDQTCVTDFQMEILPQESSVFDREVIRMGFSTDEETKAWRVTEVNSRYEICSTYPRKHVVPYWVTDEMISSIAQYRCHQRFPTIVWRDKMTGLVMARCSQPSVGILYWRNTNDEAFISSIGESCLKDPGTEAATVPPGEQPLKNLMLIDARSYTAAQMNRAKGGGVESEDNYTNAELVFMSLPNIHSVRKSFNYLRQISGSQYDETSWLTSLDQTKWLFYISCLLKSALVVVDSIRVDRKSVLVHCSDGWDRTPQILSLAQILLDPHYRTREGFRDLVEKEWLEFGHKFADRCGQGACSSDPNDRSPVFLQWLDCVHQIHHQFSFFFEFNANFLAKLAYHTYSCLFGNFLHNCDRDRLRSKDHKTVSIWGFLLKDKKFRNPLYQKTDEVLRPRFTMRDVHLWSQVYLTQSSTVMTSLLIEQLKLGAEHAGEGPGEKNSPCLNMGEGKRTSDTSQETVSPVGLDTETKKRSQSLDRQSPDEFNPTDRRALQSLSLENFESNMVSSSHHHHHHHNNENEEQFVAASGDVSPFLTAQNQETTYGEQSKYSTPTTDDSTAVPSVMSEDFQDERRLSSLRVSRTKQEAVEQPTVSRDESSRKIFRQMDVDGLAAESDLLTDVVNNRIELYEAKLSEQRRLLKQEEGDSAAAADCKDDAVSDSSSSTTAGWEMLNPNSNRLAMWVPDHAASHCFGCEREFWMALRRHHCRACGKVFCYYCTMKSMPCPDQNLNIPVRVCDECYRVASTLIPK